MQFFSPLIGNNKYPKKIPSSILQRSQTAISRTKTGGKNFYYALFTSQLIAIFFNKIIICSKMSIFIFITRRDHNIKQIVQNCLDFQIYDHAGHKRLLRKQFYQRFWHWQVFWTILSPFTIFLDITQENYWFLRCKYRHVITFLNNINSIKLNLHLSFMTTIFV